MYEQQPTFLSHAKHYFAHHPGNVFFAIGIVAIVIVFTVGN